MEDLGHTKLACFSSLEEGLAMVYDQSTREGTQRLLCSAELLVCSPLTSPRDPEAAGSTLWQSRGCSHLSPLRPLKTCGLLWDPLPGPLQDQQGQLRPRKALSKEAWPALSTVRDKSRPLC